MEVAHETNSALTALLPSLENSTWHSADADIREQENDIWHIGR